MPINMAEWDDYCETMMGESGQANMFIWKSALHTVGLKNIKLIPKHPTSLSEEDKEGTLWTSLKNTIIFHLENFP